MDDDDTGYSGSSSAAAADGEPSAADLKELFHKAALVRGANNKAQLYENGAFSLTYMADYRLHAARVAIFLSAKQAIQSVQLTVNSPEGLNIRLQTTELPGVAVGEEQRILLAVETMRPFADAPQLSLTYTVRGGRTTTATVKLPITVVSFSAPLPADKTTYMNRWKAITAERTENQLIFSSARTVDATLFNYIRTELFPAAQVGLAEGLDNDRTFTGSLSFQTGTQGADGKPVAVGAMLRIEADAANNKFRITVRATHPTVSAAVKDFFVGQLGV